jgi:hypothetical protein
MKRSRIHFLSLLVFCISLMACHMNSSPTPDSSNDTPATDTTGNRLSIRVGQRTYTATLLDNPTAAAFKARLPLTLSMTELNGNEKYGQLAPALPTNATNPGTIQAGDLMLYGSSTLVIFYETFRTSYSYTKIGRIDNPSGLAAALGSGNVTVRISEQ